MTPLFLALVAGVTLLGPHGGAVQIGRASCRERVSYTV